MLQKSVDMRKWREGGCETLGDLFPNEEFISLVEAQDSFNLIPEQFLQYASITAVVKEIWTSFPAAPEASNTLEGLLAWGRRGI